MPVAMPASIPNSKTTTLRHIISVVSLGGLKSHSGELGLTHRPRLCDLMSPGGLAYLILGIGTLDWLKGQGRRPRHGRLSARHSPFRPLPHGLVCSDSSAARRR